MNTLSSTVVRVKLETVRSDDPPMGSVKSSKSVIVEAEFTVPLRNKKRYVNVTTTRRLHTIIDNAIFRQRASFAAMSIHMVT